LLQVNAHLSCVHCSCSHGLVLNVMICSV